MEIKPSYWQLLKAFGGGGVEWMPSVIEGFEMRKRTGIGPKEGTFKI